MRVIAFIPDLLFGSRVAEGLRAAGHEPVLVGDTAALNRELAEAQVLVVDLTADPAERIKLVGEAPTRGIPVLAFYAHVETDVRAQAEEAGFDLVIPRSRMAREGATLVERLSEQS